MPTNILNTPNSQDQESTSFSVTAEETVNVHGDFPFGTFVQGYARKTGSSEDWEAVPELFITSPGPVNIAMVTTDVKFVVDSFRTGMAVKIEKST